MRNVLNIIVSICIISSSFIQQSCSKKLVKRTPAKPIGAIVAKPDSIKLGDKVELRWMVKYANHIEIEPGVGSVESAGSITLTPENSTKYTLRALGSGGASTYTTNVTVLKYSPRPTIEFDVVPDTIKKGEKAKLFWNVYGAQTASISDIGNINLKGEKIISPNQSSKYYILKAKGPGGEVAKTVQLVVLPEWTSKKLKHKSYLRQNNKKKLNLSTIYKNPLTFQSIGIQAGTFLMQGDWNTGINSNIIINLQKPGEDFRLQPFVGFKTTSYTKSANDKSNHDLNFSDFIVGINILFRLMKASSNSEIYAGPGLSYNLIAEDRLSESNISNTSSIKEISTKKLGFGLVGTYIHNFGTVSGLFETKYEFTHGGYNNLMTSLGVFLNLRR